MQIFTKVLPGTFLNIYALLVFYKPNDSADYFDLTAGSFFFLILFIIANIPNISNINYKFYIINSYVTGSKNADEKRSLLNEISC